ncbi:hypothetical protein [Actinoplanes sp. NPDC023714]|uniref:hypothetical protein n=1 Tax=Actinoplanes sp. NPDC023714 TaxID=3154322 RepID=UPI003401CEBD
MPIETRLDGDSGSILAAAGWLRDQLGFEVSSSSEVLRSAGSDASEGWRGSAGVAFGGRMARAAELAGALHGEISSTAGAFDAYADRLARAQGRMAAAREMAAAGGLPVHGTVIAEPVDPSAPEYARQVAVYEVAAGEAAGARAEMVEAVRGMRTRQAAAQGVPVVRSVDVVRGGGSLGAAAGGMAAGIAGSGDGSGGSVGGAAGGMAGGLSSAGGDATIRPNGEASGVITPAEGGAAEEAEGTSSEKPGSINDHSGAAGEADKPAEAGDAGSREEADGSVSERNATVRENAPAESSTSAESESTQETDGSVSERNGAVKESPAPVESSKSGAGDERVEEGSRGRLATR